MNHDKNRINLATEDEVSEFAPPAEPSEGPVDEAAALRAQTAELQDKYLRARAEVDNVVRRAQQERLEAVRYGNADLLRSLLTVVDDLERTVAAAAEASGPVVEGVRLIYEKLLKLLRDSGVETLESVNKLFNPSEHAALLQQPSPDHAPGTVIQEVQRGYRYRDRVLRPAQVIVASTAEGETGRGGEGDTR